MIASLDITIHHRTALPLSIDGTSPIGSSSSVRTNFGPTWSKVTCALDTIFKTGMLLNIGIAIGDQMTMKDFHSLAQVAKEFRIAMCSPLSTVHEINKWRDLLYKKISAKYPDKFPSMQFWSLDALAFLLLSGSPLLSWKEVRVRDYDTTLNVHPEIVHRASCYYVHEEYFGSPNANIGDILYDCWVQYEDTTRESGTGKIFLDSAPPILLLIHPTLPLHLAEKTGLFKIFNVTIEEAVLPRTFNLDNETYTGARTVQRQYTFLPLLIWYRVNSNHYILRVRRDGGYWEYNGMKSEGIDHPQGKLHKVESFASDLEETTEVVAAFHELLVN